jgi:hypothetical protein
MGIDGTITVRELIMLLQALPADLPVYLGDWNEEHAYDHPLGEEEDAPRVAPADPPDRYGVTRPARVVIGRGKR